MKITKYTFAASLISLFFAGLAQAEDRTLQIQCQKPSQTTMNRFSVEGDLVIRENKEAEGIFSLNLSLAGSDESSEMSLVTVKGSIQVIPAGQLYVDEISIIQLSGGEEGMMNYRLVVGSKGEAVSSLLVDGAIYKSNCSIK